MTRRTMYAHNRFGQGMATAVVAVALFSPETNAYMQRPQHAFRPRVRNTQSTSALSAWSLSAPAFSTPSLGASWYNEVNPTARTTVYDDAPLDFTFSAPGSDWPDTASQTSSESSQSPQRINPLRRAAKWAFGSRKNQSSQ